MQVLVLGLAALLVAVAAARLGLGRVAAAVTGVAASLVLAVATTLVSPIVTAGRPLELHENGYVSSDTCRACHPSEYETWRASYHRNMTQLALPSRVLGDFDAVELESEGRRYRLGRDGDALWLELDDPLWTGSGEAPRVRRPIVLTTGSHHMQVYWYASGRGRELGLFPLAHFVEDDAWVPLRANFIQPPLPAGEREPLPIGDWNRACINCHAVRGEPRLDGAEGAQSVVAELGIACEACHGPADAHVRAHRTPLHRWLSRRGDEADPTITHPGKLSHALGSQVCGRCHAVYQFEDVERVHRVGIEFEPGRRLEEFGLHLVRGRVDDPGAFWPDGMVRLAGREYTALIDSPCYAGGEFSCFSCHRMHKQSDDDRPLAAWTDDQLDPGMRTDAACLQCHPSFAARIEEHSHHRAGSAGSACYDCHMPYTSLGLRKAIRSHQVSVPRASVELETERPTACSGCHLDRSIGWTARWLAEWYGQPEPEISALRRAVPASVIRLLSGDAASRALEAWSMGRDAARRASDGDAWMAPFLAGLLDDPYDAVRYHARRALRRQRGFADFDYDFMGPPELRREAARAAAERWRDARRAAGASTDTDFLLRDPTGEITADVYGRLREQRDDRPIVIKE